MMTTTMDNNKGSCCRERVQRLFNKNVELENNCRKATQAQIPSDPNTWRQIRENYESIILEDHTFSEQHDIEYTLWQLHYRRIEHLRSLLNEAKSLAASQNGKGPVRVGPPDRLAKTRTKLKTFLSEASGFYHDLMLKIKAKHGLPLGYFSDEPENQIPISKNGNISPELESGLKSCHRCLIYLGDLARYKGLYGGDGDSKTREFAAASSYYVQASSLWSSSGNPHHQLAILAGYSNDELLSIYRYFRSLAVDSPFVTARDNLVVAFEKNRENYTQLFGDSKSTSQKTAPSRTQGKGRGKGETKTSSINKAEPSSIKETATSSPELFRVFKTRFIRLNGILFTRTSLETFSQVFSIVKHDFLELLSYGPDEEFNFGSNVTECRLTLVRLIAVLIFTVRNMKENDNQSYADILQRSVLLQNAFTAIFQFMGNVVARCDELSDPSSSYLLPGIMVFLEWLACCQVDSEFEEKQANERSFFWTNCISLLNKLLSSGCKFDDDEKCFSSMSNYDENETVNRLALPEDVELRGFLPLLPAQLILDFSRKRSFGADKEKTARLQRIISAAKALVNVVRIGKEGVYFDSKLKKFVIGVETEVVSDGYLLASPLEIPKLTVDTQNVSSGIQMEDEDEDEVIVFKPSTTEKHINEIHSQFISDKVLASDSGASKDDFVNENVSSFSAGHNSFVLQNASTRQSVTTASKSSSRYLPPFEAITSNWQAPIMNGLVKLNMMENGFVTTTGTGYTNPIQFPTAPFRSSVDGSSAMSPAGLKKNPMSRPVRHLGPPPGFSSVSSKVVDESKKQYPPIPQLDDYRWLDGYQLSSSVNQSTAFGNSVNQSEPTFISVSKSNGSMRIAASFPFPGKQVQSENQRGSKGNQQQQLQNGNQQSLWEGRFFV